MKVFQVVASAALATIALTAPTNAADCTADELKKMVEIGKDASLKTACPSIAGELDAGLTSSAALQAACKDPKCVDAIQAMIAKFPKCEIKGEAVSKAVENAMAKCKKDGDKTTKTPNTTRPASSRPGATPLPSQTKVNQTTSGSPRPTAMETPKPTNTTSAPAITTESPKTTPSVPKTTTPAPTPKKSAAGAVTATSTVAAVLATAAYYATA